MAARITGASLDPILTRLNGVDNYHPLDADTFSDWSIEAGDLVTVSRDGVQYKSPVHTSTMTWKGTTPQVQIRSTGKETRDPVSVASRKKYGRGSSALLNSQQAYRDITTSYNNMKAGLILASSAASLYVEDMYNQMKSGLDLTSSSASLYVEDRYNQMKAGLDLTSSSASLYVEDRYNQMKAGLDLTSSSASLYVDSKYDQMKAGLDLTSSSASLYVDSKYNQMKAGLDLTSSSAALYVQDAYNRMKSGLDVTSSSAALYTESKTTRAAIITRINADGEGEALIAADKVSITGATTINSVFKVEDDGIIVKKSSVFQGNMLLQTAGSKLKIGSSASLEFLGTTAYSIDNASIGTTIKDASKSSDGKTLTLTRYNGTTLTFEKAASMSGSWSSGSFPLTVTDDLDTYTIGIGGSYGAHDVELEVVGNGSISKSSTANSIDIPITVNSLNSGQTAPTSRYTKTLAMGYSSLVQSKTVDPSVSAQTITPDSGKIGLSSVTVTAAVLQAKTVSPSTSAQDVTPDSGYYGLSKVTVTAAVKQAKTVSASTSQNVEVTPDSGYYGLSKVTVNKINVQAKVVSPSTSSVTVLPDSGYSYLTSVTINPINLGTKTVTCIGVGGTTYSASSDGYQGYSSFTVNGIWMFTSTTKPKKQSNQSVDAQSWDVADGYYYYFSTSNNGIAYGDECWYGVPHQSGTVTSSNIQIDTYEYKSSQPSGTQAQNMWNSIKNGWNDPTMKYWRFRVYVQNPNNTSQILASKYYWFQYT